VSLPPPSLGLRLGGREYAPGRLLVMAIVNRTPDSFYPGARRFDLPRARGSGAQAVEGGADIVDVGGVPAGPGPEVDTAEETRRVVPFVSQVRAAHPGVVVSVDTWRSEVADEACAAGALLINDTWAGHDHRLPGVAAKYGAGLVCSHTGGASPRTLPHRVSYGRTPDAVVDEVLTSLLNAARQATAAGVPPESILLDPTIDFGKNTWHGLSLLRRMELFNGFDSPVMLSISRKDIVGETLGVAVQDRLEGTLAATSVAAWLGVKVFRVHDVRATRRTLDMVMAIRGDRAPVAPLRGLA
jgi:dihydropteroate synthase